MAIAERVYSLSYAVRFPVVSRYLGQLFLAVAIMTIVPLIVAILFGETALSLRLAVVVAALSAAGVVMARQPAPKHLQTNEAMVITALVFLLVPLIMAFPMMEPDLAFLDALFETVSAITTTGLTTLGTVGDKSDAFLFTRAWMQWYGGLGIVVLSLALLIGPEIAARQLGHATMEWNALLTGSRLHARRVFQVYLSLTVAGVVILWFVGVDWYSALLHTLAGISTGGFSTHDDSLAGLGGWSARAALMVLAFAGAMSLALYHPAYARTRRERIGYLEMKWLLGAALVTSLSLGLCMATLGPWTWQEALNHAPLVAVSAQTGAGFTSIDMGQLDASSKLVLIISMLIGGGVGSTAGGIKILRLAIMLRLLQLLIQRTCMPRQAVLDPRLGGHRLEHREIGDVLLVILLFLIVILLSWFPFLALGFAPLDALFEVVSATATVGLSTGVTAPDLPPLLKVVLCLDMLLGRLEVVALLLILYPLSWIGKRNE